MQVKTLFDETWFVEVRGAHTHRAIMRARTPGTLRNTQPRDMHRASRHRKITA
jgi:hypothetical protein